MSGIAGIIRFDNKATDRSTLNKILKPIEYRGPDGVHSLEVNGLNLFNAKMNVTKLCEKVVLPYTNENLSIVADARLDNRKELCKKLEISQNTPDHKILLIGYKKWGTDCVNYLCGAYSFAIYDGLADKLFLARDHFGQKPLYYNLNSKFFIFSSEIESILNHPDISNMIDNKRLYDYFIFPGAIENRTFFKDIKKLERGSFMTLHEGKLKSKNYLNFRKNRYENLSNDQLIQECETLFLKIVKDLSNTNNNSIASTCSGGLDSSSIASALCHTRDDDLKVFTYTSVFLNIPEKEFIKSDESEYVEKIKEKYNQNHTYINSFGTPISYSKSHINQFYFPPKKGNGFFHQEIFEQMKSDNTRVLLDGFDGDTILSHGIEYLHELAINFRIKELFFQSKKLAEKKGQKLSLRKIISNFFIRPFLYNWPLIYLFPKKIPEFNRQQFLAKKFRDKYNFWNRFKKFYPNNSHKIKKSKEKYQDILTFPSWDDELTIIEQMAAVNNIEIRFPFLDIRFVELCLAMPGELKLSNGIDRFFFRKSMKSIVPKSILEKTSKASFSYISENDLKNSYKNILEEILNSKIPLAEFLNKKIIVSLMRTEVKNLSKNDLIFIYKLFVLHNWMKFHKLNLKDI